MLEGHAVSWGIPGVDYESGELHERLPSFKLYHDPSDEGTVGSLEVAAL